MTVVAAIRARILDSELGALLWLLAEAGVPVHVASPDATDAATMVEALRPLAPDVGVVTAGGGEALEDVLRQPVPIRPATGAVVIVRHGRVAAAHFQRPPLRDAGGHIRPQGPAVLATWDDGRSGWEHFAWGVTPELADAAGRRPGDFEIELGRRREYLDALAGSDIADDVRLRSALTGYRSAGPSA